MAVKVQLRYDTTSNWSTNNPVLLSGELGIESDSLHRIKIGDGTTAWNSLTSPFLTSNSPTITTPTIDAINASANTVNTSLYTGAGTGNTTIGFNSGTVIFPGSSGLTAKTITVTSSTATSTIDTGTTNGSLFPSASGTVTVGSGAGTIAIGATATAVNIGASTGTTTIANPSVTLSNATALNINGASPAITTSSTGTASVFNTNALGLNIGGAATAVAIGATTGTTSISNTLKPATGTATLAPVQFTSSSGTLLSTPVAGAIEYDGTELYATTSATHGRGGVATLTLASTTATKSLSSATTANQPLFATPTTGALTVAASTSYLVDAFIILNTGSTTTRTISFSLVGAGTATFTSAAFETSYTVVGTAGTLATPQNTLWTSATGGVINATNTSTLQYFRVKGIIRVNASGTIIPAITFSAAPGGTNTTGINSFFTLTPVGSNTATTIGAWA